MLIYNQRRIEIVNLNAIQRIYVEESYVEDIYAVRCEAQCDLITLGRYKSTKKAAAAMNEISNAYGDGKRVFFMPQD